MPAYLIADTNITDPDRYEEYKRQVAPMIAKAGGRYLARGGSHHLLEGDWHPVRMVVIEFPSIAALKGWYDSPEYQPIRALRESASTGRLIAVEGM